MSSHAVTLCVSIIRNQGAATMQVDDAKPEVSAQWMAAHGSDVDVDIFAQSPVSEQVSMASTAFADSAFVGRILARSVAAATCKFASTAAHVRSPFVPALL